jgi:hypothetical protein
VKEVAGSVVVVCGSGMKWAVYHGKRTACCSACRCALSLDFSSLPLLGVHRTGHMCPLLTHPIVLNSGVKCTTALASLPTDKVQHITDASAAY